jgi:hypothetical protein
VNLNSKEHPEIQDFASAQKENWIMNEDSESIFSEHLEREDLIRGVKEGKYFQG